MSQAPSGTEDRYDAFISYRSASSGRHARHISQALFRLSKRHLDSGDLRLFLDTSTLNAGDLGRNIENALAHSTAVVVLLDATTKDSPWVRRELTYWFTHGGSPERTFLVRTDPALDLSWNEREGRFNHPGHLPTPLRSVFTQEQKYFDALQTRRIDDASLGGLYAALMGISPTDLFLEEARYQRTRRRRSATLIGVLIALLAIALLSGLLANQRGRQARGEAVAANALLTVPYSHPLAIEAALEASTLVDSQSVRSALVAVAGETSALRRTIDWAAAGTGRPPTGMAFNSDGSRLTAWGPTREDSSESRVATWDVTSGQLITTMTLPLGWLSDVTPIDGVGYLACSTQGLVLIQRAGNTTLWEGDASGPQEEGVADVCTTHTFGGGALAEIQEHTGEPGVFQVSPTGKVHTFPSFAVARVEPSSWTAALTSDTHLTLVSATASASTPLPPDAYLEQATTNGWFLLRGNQSGYWRAGLNADETIVLEPLPLPPDTDDVVLLPSLESPSPYAWVTTAGVVGTSAGDTYTLSPAPSLSMDLAAVPELELLGSDGDLAAQYQGVLYTIDEFDNPPVRVRASVGGDGLNTGDCQTGGPILIGEGGALFENEMWDITTNTSIQGCRLIQPGPPFSIDNTPISAGFLDGNIVVAPNGTVGIFSQFQPLQILSIDASERAWRVTPDDHPLSGGGDRILTIRGERLHSSSTTNPTDDDILGPVDPPVTILMISPDGRSAIVVDGERRFLLAGGRAKELIEDCQEGAWIGFLPGPGFDSSVEAAVAQVPMTGGAGSVSCVDGSPGPSITSNPLAGGDIVVGLYEVREGGGAIVWYAQDGGLVWKLTRWSGGRILTRDLDMPGLSQSSSFAVSSDGAQVLVSDRLSGTIRSFRWRDGGWEPVRSYQGSLGSVSAAGWSPDGEFVVGVGAEKGFELFDTTSGQRLILDPDNPAAGTGVQTSQSDGYLFVHVSGEETAAIEIPVGRDKLQQVLCAVHQAEVCKRVGK